MAAPKLQLFLRGELVHEIPFDRPTIRIGRMRENELVINNLSVSRFHAKLEQTEQGFALQDLGSENGLWVNGRRVKACRVGPGDRIQIGKHEIHIVPDGEAETRAPAPASGDPQSAAPPELMEPEGEELLPAPARSVRAAQPDPFDLATLDTDGEVAPPAASADGADDLFGEVDAAGELQAPDLAEFDVSEIDLRDPAPPAAETAQAAPEAPAPLLDVPAAKPPADLLDEPDPEDAATELVGLTPAAPPAAEPPPAEGAGAADGHAGLILQRGGRLERVIGWQGDRMILGRATECDIVLATPEVSRRHAMIVRDGDRFEVRDLESINGTFVNGERVTRRTLQVGDVVRVEDFELTFLIDREPVDEAVRAERPAPAPPGAPDPGLTQIGELMDLAPFVAEEDSGDTATAMSFEPGESLESLEPQPDPEPPGAPEALDEVPLEELGLTEVLESPPAVSEPDRPEPDTQLLVEEPDEEKDLVESPREARVLRLELRVRLEELPPPLRDALASLDPADLRLPVELRLATEES